MAARIIHFGGDSCHRLSVLRHAGYSVGDYGTIAEFRIALEGKEPPDAVAISEGPLNAPQDAISLARSRSSAPLILFRDSQRTFPESDFDLVIPVLVPPERWLVDIDELIARSQRMRAASAELRAQSSAVRETSRAERERSRQLIKRLESPEGPIETDARADPNRK